MSHENTSGSIQERFVSIDDIRAEHPVTPEQLAAFHGVLLDPGRKTGQETRYACPFPQCASQRCSDRVISVKRDARGFIWKCFRYGCAHGGNDVAFSDLIRDNHGDGRPRRERFKATLEDYRQMAAGENRRVVEQPSGVERKNVSVDEEDPENVPLRDSENEKARALIDLPEKFITDQGSMPPYAASYQRTRPWFQDPDWVLKEFGVGYMPKGTPGDHTGGTMRDKIVFPIRSRAGEILAFCGRDPDWERKQASWSSLSEEKRSQEKKPAKWRFPSKKMFRKGRELWGQDRLKRRGIKKHLREQGGLWIVEGAGDVINLARGKIVAVALMWNDMTSHQVELLREAAWELADGHLTALFDLDDEGRKGMWHFLQKMALRCYVQIGWSSENGMGKWTNREPEQLSLEEMEEVKGAIRSRREQR